MEQETLEMMKIIMKEPGEYDAGKLKRKFGSTAYGNFTRYCMNPIELYVKEYDARLRLTNAGQREYYRRMEKKSKERHEWNMAINKSFTAFLEFITSIINRSKGH